MGYLALDTETTGLGYWDTAFCVSRAWRNPAGELCSDVRYDLDDPMRWPELRANDVELVFHNAKFDLQKLVLAGLMSPDIDWYRIHDTECLSHLVNEQQPKALKRLAKELLGLETDESEALRAARRKLGLKKADGYDALPSDVLEPYARKDAEFTLLLFEYLWPEVQADPDLLRLYREEQELMGVLFDMERQGLGVDVEYVNDYTKQLADNILRLELRLRDLTGNEDFNPNSPVQVKQALADRGLNLESTRKDVLKAIDDEFVEVLLQLRHDSKLYSSYFKPLQTEVRDGILHPNHKQWGTKGRRFSAGSTEDS